MAILYISYDGVLEPLGQSQVLCYLRELAKGRQIHLISYEKSHDLEDSARIDLLRSELVLAGVTWYPVRYHKSPTVPATCFDIGVGILMGVYVGVRYKISVVHARGYVASLIATVISRVISASFIFDMRGFWPEEKLDGNWRIDSRIYRVTKWFEKRFYIAADHIICLTEAAVPIISNLAYLKGRVPPITVIPTCANLEHFRPFSKESLRDELVIGYVGTATNWYLFDQTAACFAEIFRIRPEVKFLIINRGEHEYIRSKLDAYFVPPESVELISATYEEMPQLMARMHASVYFIKPVFSKKASSATKLGELLGCGIPCMTNWGVGDVEVIFHGERIGAILQSFEKTSMVEGINQLFTLVDDPYTSSRCRSVAEKWFSLQEGVKRYNKIYECLNSSSR